ncbi:glycosyltransferase family 4 protein [Rubritalea marina]|uniref:glycosyltransferase family 4 protein n=1 Tax=Rubritalea marina TaxID=361055 RepID=UPI0003633E33|nr:glycosyltransferase family 4 protein [Rubritalea marina]
MLELILGNSNKKFSGVSSTMLQVLPYQQEAMKLAVLGAHHLPDSAPCIGILEAAKRTKAPLSSGGYCVFHARRNDEMIQALILKKLLGAKIRIVFTSTAQRHHSKFTKWLIGQMDGIITTSKYAGAYLDRPADITIPHGVDEQIYTPAADKQAAWSALGLPGKFGIGIFGRVRHQKGLDLLVDAAIPLFKDNPDPTIVVVGETTAKHQSYLDSQIHKMAEAGLADRIIVLGKQPFSEIPKLMRSMSIVAALSRNEGYGLTAPEAMASGTAVLASEAGAWREVVRDRTDGFVVPCGDTTATRMALKSLLTMTEHERNALGQAGRNRILDHYTVEQEAAALCSYYRQLSKSS